jgi:hypothetical protein
LIDRPEVPDALLRINECLREGEIALEHTKAIARNDLSELTDYISKLESVMDDIQTRARGWEVIPQPWVMFRELMFKELMKEKEKVDET